MRLEDYLKIRNSGSGYSLSNKEMEFLNLTVGSKGWINKYLDNELTEQDINSLVKLVINNVNIKPSVKSSVRSILLNKPDWDEQFLYFMQTEGRVKIGISKNPEARARNLTTGSGVIVSLKTYWKVKAVAREVESLLLNHFSKFRLKGEWFEEGYFTTTDIESLLPCTFERVYDSIKV